MIRLLAVLVLSGLTAQAQTITETFGSGANQFSIDFVQIGNPGNAANNGGFGSVPYTYNLGIYEISRDQVQKADAAGGLGISLYNMNYYGSAANGPNGPATGISWNEAARFVNWLNSNQGHQVAYNFTSSSANSNITVWGEGQYTGSNQFRHKDAYYFLPSRDEWYKAAYYDPNLTVYPGYWDYPTGSNSAPNPVSGGTSGAVYRQNGPAEVTNAGGLSPYGTMAQGGNVLEWNENAYDLSNDSPTENRELSGGYWKNDGYGSNLDASSRHPGVSPNYEYEWMGFRVASVPEPSSLSLLVAGGLVALARRRKA